MGRREVDTASYVAFARRIIRAAGARVAQADDWDLAELISLRDDVEEAIVAAVAGLRDQGHSWQYIGDALGVKRHTAYERYAEKVSVVEALADEMSGDMAGLALAASGLTNQTNGSRDE